MATNWQAMQVLQTMVGSGKDARKMRIAVSDVNVKQMSMGSWKASLSKGGQASGLKGRTIAERPIAKGKL
jgi:hypothetical protein